MPSESEVLSKETEKSDSSISPYALLFELEGCAVATRRAEFETIRSLLGADGVKVTPPLFSRICLNLPPAVYLPRVLAELGIKKITAERLIPEIESGVAMFLASPEAVLHPRLKKLLAAARARKMKVGLLTKSKEATAKALAEKWAKGDEKIHIYSMDIGAKAYPRADIWLKLAKSISRTPRQCVVAAGSMYSINTALSAGMRCMAIPDEFTTFQDYSGADVVFDTDTEVSEEEIIDIICPAEPFI